MSVLSPELLAKKVAEADRLLGDSSDEDIGPDNATDHDLSASVNADADADADVDDDDDDGDGVGIPDNDMGIADLHRDVDLDFFNSLQSVDTSKFGAEELKYTDEQISALDTTNAKRLTKTCRYTVINPSNNNVSSKASISTTGSKATVIGKLLAYYARHRQQECSGTMRPFSTSGVFTPSGDARLIEIMSTAEYMQATRLIFETANRPELDVASGPVISAIWSNVVAALYNNFEKFQPPLRFPSDNHLLGGHNPNCSTIPRRHGEVLKARYAQLRTKVTILNTNWDKSGGNDPDMMREFLPDTKQDDLSAWYFWLNLKSGNAMLMRRTMRKLENGVDSMNVDAMLQGFAGVGSQGGATDRSENNDDANPTSKQTKALIASTLSSMADPEHKRLQKVNVAITTSGFVRNEMDAIEKTLLEGGISKKSKKRKRRSFREMKAQLKELKADLKKLQNGTAPVPEESEDGDGSSSEESFLQTSSEES